VTAKKDRALYEAIAHVHRQQFAGSHEQDRADAKKWLKDYADIVKELQKKYWGKKANRG
jgi:hypothetical protein